MHPAKQLAILRGGVSDWNKWRADSPNLTPDLTGADLAGTVLPRVNFSNAILRGARFERATLVGGDFRGADASGAVFTRSMMKVCQFEKAKLDLATFKLTDLSGSRFAEASIHRANFKYARVRKCDFARADLDKALFREAHVSKTSFRLAMMREADLQDSTFNRVGFEGANISKCKVHGLNAWRPDYDSQTIMSELVISADDEPVTTVDDIAVAQFVDLMLYSARFRALLSTATSRAVLILGRFSATGVETIDAIKQVVRTCGLAPVVFDFPALPSRTLKETICALAHLSRFVIADLSDARCVPQELMAIVPQLPSVPILGVLQNSDQAWGMLESLTIYPWFTGVTKFTNKEELLTQLPAAILRGPEAWLKERGNSL